MNIALAGGVVRVFTISPRTLDKKAYWENILNVVAWSEKYDCTGVLIFAGNDTYLEPWVVAQAVFERTERLCPLIAVNPVYMHPFTAAKMASSYASIYGRKTYLNLITGTAVSYLEMLNDDLTHDDRYVRLAEYARIFKSLVDSTRPVTFDGRFYKVSNLQLLPGVPPELRPEYLISGQSEAARRVAGEIGAVGMQMLPPTVERTVPDVRAIHFGIVARPEESAAWEAARRLFPENLEDQEILDLSMQNTDSVWKKQMRRQIDEPDASDPGFWLEPFRNFKADCPYLVGDYQRVADTVVALVEKGVGTFVLDLPAHEEEFEHAHAAFRLAAERLTKQPA